MAMISSFRRAGTSTIERLAGGGVEATQRWYVS